MSISSVAVIGVVVAIIIADIGVIIIINFYYYYGVVVVKLITFIYLFYKIIIHLYISSISRAA